MRINIKPKTILTLGWLLLGVVTIAAVTVALYRIPGHNTWAYLAQTQSNGMQVMTTCGLLVLLVSLCLTFVAMGLLMGGADLKQRNKALSLFCWARVVPWP